MNVHCIRNMIAERTVTAWSGTTPTAWNDIWLHYDLLGNVVGWHGPSGEFTRADRDAYGRPLPGTIAAQTPSGYGQTTKPRDPATGLIWFGARWYDPENGRWLEPEPTGKDGPNLYQYGYGQVTNGFDATGQAWWPPHQWHEGVLQVIQVAAPVILVGVGIATGGTATIVILLRPEY